MEVYGFRPFRLFFILIGVALILLAFSSSCSSSSPDMVYHGNRVAAVKSIGRQEEMSYSLNFERKRDRDNIELEDYHLIDPVPSSKAAIKSRLIEHDTPLVPYIPKLAPPNQPKHDGSP